MNSSGARFPARALRLTPVGRWSSALRAAGAALSVQAVPNRPAQAWTWPDPIGSRRDAGAGASSERPGRGSEGELDAVAPPLAEASARAGAALPRLPGGAIDTWPVAFTGADGEYARLWFQGALLTLLTLGFYLPWARIACRRYLLRHTRVAGQALDDHRSPWTLLVRQCLVVGLLGGVALAGLGSGTLGWAAATLGLAVWPMLKLLALSQGLQGTTWARRPMAFDAGLLDVYQAVASPLACVALLVWSWMAVAWWGHAAGWVLWGMALGGSLLALPGWCWAWLRFRQTHVRLGPLRMRWRLGADAISGVMLQALAAVLLLLAFNLGLASMCVGGALWWRSAAAQAVGVSDGLLTSLCVACLAVSLAWVWPQAHARTHKLVWNRTGNRHVRVRCRLRVSAIARMQRRHGLLLLLTLGLYWPWAQIQAHRMRLNATVLQARVGLATLTAQWPVK